MSAIKKAVEDLTASKKRKAEDALGSYRVPNPLLSALDVDHLYHFGLDTTMDLKHMFGNVKFVCMGGSADRMKKVAERLRTTLDIELPVGAKLAPIGKTERYSMYKVGPVICINHGMGMPSLSILLHEMSKLLMYAGAENFMFIRIGTSGGLGIAPGTVVVTTEAVNGLLEPVYSLPVLGKLVHRPATLDVELCERVLTCAKQEPPIAACLGKTMGTDCFYEGQGRLDGAICDYTEADKMAFLKRAHEAGVRNIEMEGNLFAAFCKATRIPGLVLCCTLLDRLNGDQVDATPEQLSGYADNAISLASRFIVMRLAVLKMRRLI